MGQVRNRGGGGERARAARKSDSDSERERERKRERERMVGGGRGKERKGGREGGRGGVVWWSANHNSIKYLNIKKLKYLFF